MHCMYVAGAAYLYFWLGLWLCLQLWLRGCLFSKLHLKVVVRGLCLLLLCLDFLLMFWQRSIWLCGEGP